MTVAGFFDVTLAIGGRTILSGSNLLFDQAEFVGVFGANGVGKTTLLRSILGLVLPVKGRITVLGEAPRRGHPAIGYLPQSGAIAAAARLRGWDVVASAAGGTRWGLPLLRAGARRNVQEVLDLVGGADLARREFASLSGGERQLLRLAQALLGGPRLLLLDEPLAGLDLPHQKSVVTLVRRLQQSLGITVLFSAHDINPLLGAMDRVLYLGGGRAALGTVEDIISAPVLSGLYGAPIDVIRLENRIFVIHGV